MSNNSTFSKMSEEAKKIRLKYPNKSPIVIINSDPQLQIEKKKFLVPNDITISEFVHYVRKYVKNLKPSQSIFLFIKDEIPVMSSLISSPKYFDEDGFIYIKIRSESVFG